MLSALSYRLRRLDRSLRAKWSLLRPGRDPMLQTPAPLLKIEYRGRARTRTLIVFLPGIGDLAEDFERRGFIDELRRLHIAADAVAVDAHFGYYATRMVFERIADDVLAAAHAAGYDDIWLVGVSLGGFGAASYAARYQSHVSGMLLIAPYLGDKALTQQIAKAGGIAQWEPGEIAESDYQRALWAWFKQHLDQDASHPSIYLGYGKSDAFAGANAVLAEALPSDRVISLPGGHDWRTWKKIWRLFLEQRRIGGDPDN